MVPQYVYFVAEIFHILGCQILLQKNFDGHICAIPYTSENFSKEP